MVRPSRRGGVPVLRRQPRKSERLDEFAEQYGGGFAAASGGIGLLAAVDEAVEKCSGGDNDGRGCNRAAVAQANAATDARAAGLRCARRRRAQALR